MSRTGRAVIARGQEFDLREYPVPEPEPNTILLRQELSGICGTDVHNWQQGIDDEMLLGHENVGVIDSIGKGLETDHVGKPICEGDRVVFAPGGRYHFKDYGAYGSRRDPDKPPHFGGGFADYIYLNSPNTCFLRTDVCPEVAVLAEPFSVGVHAAMRGGVEIGDTVVIQGTGAIGLVTLICAKMRGVGKTIVVGGPERRLTLAKCMGADVTINIEEMTSVEERLEFVREETPHKDGADVVFECAGTLSAVIEGLDYVKWGGAFIEVGHCVDLGTLELNLYRLLMRKNLRLEAVWGSRYEHFVNGMAVLERNEFPFADMVSHILPLSGIREGFEALNSGYRLLDETAIKIVIQS